MPDDNRPLSQAEIDALLQALSTNPPEGESGQAADPPSPTPSEEEGADSQQAETAAAPSRDDQESVSRTEQRIDPRLKRTMHLPVTMFVGLGQKSLPIRSLLNWGVGTQIELNHDWQRPVSIKINGLEVGEGRVVLVGNNFGVEVTQWGRKE